MTEATFSVITALYNVEKYVSGFVSSVLAQTYDQRRIQLILVDDGSVDSSVEIALRKLRRFKGSVIIIEKENGGPASARNRGLEAAIGDWITFADPDDVLDPTYFQEVNSFLHSDVHNSAEMLTTRLVIHKDGTYVTSNSHPLDWKFRHGNMLVNLQEFPNHVQLAGGTVFVRRSVVNHYGLRFDERIRPKFEDANFIGRYLAKVETPVVGVVAKARYYYRKRTNGSSLIQSTWSHDGAYNEVPKYGYLGLLVAARDSEGNIPIWAQYMVLYDLVWSHITDKSMYSEIARMSGPQQISIHWILDEIFTLIDKEAILQFCAVPMGWTFFNMILLHYKTPLEPSPVIINWGSDGVTHTRKLSYMFVGQAPDESIWVNDKRVLPIAKKTISHSFFGRVLVSERVWVLPEGHITAVLDGHRARITTDTNLPKRSSKNFPSAKLHAPDVRRAGFRQFGFLKGKRTTSKHTFLSRAKWWPKLVSSRAQAVSRRLSLQASLLDRAKFGAALYGAGRVFQRRYNLVARRRLAIEAAHDWGLLASSSTLENRQLYAHAWVLMDRVDRADDNAEHLYRFLQENRDENIWFLLSRKSDDWARLEADGFRLIEYGSDASVPLILNADYLISSHADREIQYPIDAKKFGNSGAKIVFLQHGVIKDDLSRWLNGKNLSMLVTTTLDEYNSIVGDNTPYRWGREVVKMTGLPRHDKLLLLAEKSPFDARGTILFAPTWRQYLNAVLSADPASAANKFSESSFAQSWLGLLRSPEVRNLSYQGYKVVFLAHPNLDRLLPYISFPEDVAVRTYNDVSIQELLVNSRLVVSDYSSLVFDAALAGCSIMHFQFDDSEIFQGAHVYRKGYFDYESQGFGPVSRDLESARCIIRQMAVRDFVAPDDYLTRVRETFLFWDKNNCARVTQAIQSITQRHFSFTTESALGSRSEI